MRKLDVKIRNLLNGLPVALTDPQRPFVSPTEVAASTQRVLDVVQAAQCHGCPQGQLNVLTQRLRAAGQVQAELVRLCEQPDAAERHRRRLTSSRALLDCIASALGVSTGSLSQPK